MATRIRIVDVQDGQEVTWAELDGGQVTYAPTGQDIAEAVVRNRMNDFGVDLETAFAQLQQDGWSNGYLMVDRAAGDERPA